ncbi:hypothetical protein F0562_023616 [Nyssa sinensis]|uniref:Integrase catalytic domain-containing protein n=1 Tax=Nyssa sinensis TaxID=561372 RepID=A0A5J5BI07_9ASTE|nr:hypothetical protein F0562_023616 [Nyssa sinensis]
MGKELWGQIDGSVPAPTEPKELAKWTVNDARVMSWILGSVDPLIVLNLWVYETAKAMWEYLQKSKRDQFLMKLRPEFEVTRSNLMNRDPSPYLDVCFGELLREEQRLFTQAAFQQDANPNPVAYATYGRGKGKDMRMSSTSSSAAGSSSLTPEMVQQMIMSAFSAFGLQANGSHFAINEIGDTNSTFKDVYVSPRLSNNLISVGQLVEKNCDVHFSRDGCLVQDQVLGKILAKGPKVGRLFPLQFSIPSSLSLACMTVHTPREVWHKRLGHPNFVILSRMLNSSLLGNKEYVSKHLSFDCSVCKLGKSKTLLFPSHGSRAATCFDIVHSDVWGISPIISHARYKYFVTFIDDFSRYTWVYFLWAKSEVLSVFQNFVAYIENQFSTCIKMLRFDSGGEYMSREFYDFLHHKGIVSQRSCLGLRHYLLQFT